MCLAASSVSPNVQDERHYTEGPVTEVDAIHVEYGHFEEYIDWLNSHGSDRRKLLKADHHRLQGPQSPKITGPAQYLSLDHFKNVNLLH
jgi:hypothetical protein